VSIDFSTWGPLTVLAVAVILLVVIGGLVMVILGNMTFEEFVRQLTLLAGLVGGGAAIGRGTRLSGTPVKTRSRR
jgi:hypothetical protein